MDMDQLGYFVFMEQQEQDQEEQPVKNRSSELNIIVGTDEPHQTTI